MALVVAGSSNARIPSYLAANVRVPRAPKPIEPGTRVMALDRNNFGKVCSIDPYRRTALVHFFVNADGREAFVRLHLSLLVAQ